MWIRPFLFLCFLVPGFVSAETSDPRGVLSEIANKVRFYRLENGLRVILYPRSGAPVFGAAVGVRVGGIDESIGETGISHMFEHMAFKGTTRIGTKDYARERVLLAEQEQIVREQGAALKLSAEGQKRWDQIQAELNTIWDRNAFVRELQQHGASGLNANTDKELTRYFMNLPRSAFEFWCAMESERLVSPVMREFYQERDVVMEEKRMRFSDSPAGRLYETLLQVAYLAHQYRNPVIGYDEDLRHLTATAVDDFRKKYYVPGNIVVSVVGAVNPEADLGTISKYFGRLPAAPMPEREVITEPPQLGERVVTLRLPAAPQMYIAYHKPNYPHPDDPPISLAVEMFAGSKTSPLYSELVKRRQLAADVGSEEGPGAGYPNLNIFFATTRSPHTNDEVLRAFDEVLKRFRTGALKEEDLQIAKHKLAMEHLVPMQSNLSMAVDFVTSELMYNDWKAFLDWYDQAMKVQLTDIRRVSEEYLGSAGRTVGRLETKAEARP